MDSFQTFIMLFFVAAILVGIAQKIRVPYPIALVLGGTAIGFLPFREGFFLHPESLLVIVLPPILSYSAYGISIREFRHNLGDIISLALGLVLFTTVVIALLFKWLFPQLPWELAFAFGAIVSPPDAISATSILKRFAISSRLLSILEGESLINDASALVLYKIAVVALVTGTFSLAGAGAEFIYTVTGGIVVGLVLGYLLQNFSRYFLEPIVGVLFSFTIPYTVYILADWIGVSGVLAVVVNGLIGSKILIRYHLPLRRILGYATWDIFIILMNCFVFIMIGLQLHTLVNEFNLKDMIHYTGYAVLITLAMIAVRMVWVYAKYAIPYITALHMPKAHIICPQILREAAITGWSGMRGIVSLTAALALPYPLEGRSEVVFITFVVILLTLLIPGLTLETLIRRLKIHHSPKHQDLVEIKKQLFSVAEETVHKLHSQNEIDEEEFALLKSFLGVQKDMLVKLEAEKLQKFQSVRSLVIQQKRDKLFEMWKRLEISDKLLAQVEHELDLEETHLARAILN